MAVLFGLDGLRDVTFRAAHGEKHLSVLRDDGLALLNVGEEVFGGLAPITDVCAEESVPVVEHVEEVVLGDRLFLEKFKEGHLRDEVSPALGNELLLLGGIGEIEDVGEVCFFSRKGRRVRKVFALFAFFAAN